MTDTPKLLLNAPQNPGLFLIALFTGSKVFLTESRRYLLITQSLWNYSIVCTPNPNPFGEKIRQVHHEYVFTSRTYTVIFLSVIATAVLISS